MSNPYTLLPFHEPGCCALDAPPLLLAIATQHVPSVAYFAYFTIVGNFIRFRKAQFVSSELLTAGHLYPLMFADFGPLLVVEVIEGECH